MIAKYSTEKEEAERSIIGILCRNTGNEEGKVQI